MKQFLPCLIFALISTCSTAQSVKHEVYLPNIVYLEGQIYGLIVGQEGNTYYFITADQSKPEEIPAELNTYFYKSNTNFKAQQVRTFNFKGSRLYLYAVKANTAVDWRKAYYQYYSKASAPFYSYIGDSKQNSTWYPNSREFTKNQLLSKAEIQLATVRGNVYAQGMPVIDSFNSIVGIISSSMAGEEFTPLTTMIDIGQIADELISASDCKYFQLVEFGQPANRCDTERQVAQKDKQLKERIQRDNRMRGIAIAPVVSVGLSASYEDNAGNSTSGAKGYALGVNLITNPDAGRVRFAIKPRALFTEIKPGENVTSSSPIGFQAKKFSWYNVDVPIFAEFVFSRMVHSTGYFGLGYTLGYQTDIDYEFSYSGYRGNLVNKAVGTAGFVQKPTAEIGIEGGRLRLDLFFWYQLSDWNKSQIYRIAKTDVNPFEGMQRHIWTIGLELSFRINGKWGMKSIPE